MTKNIIILGSGESGVGAALLAKQQGYNVFVSDAGIIATIHKNELQKNNIEFEEGKHSEDKILNADEIIKSPGIPEKNELIKKIRAKNISIISEIEFAYRHKGDSKIIAITGSNGKTTTTSLVFHIAKLANIDCAMVGNIGFSFARQVAQEPKQLYVLEISSFQLDDIKTFKPNVAIITNITEDHLDRYEYKVENYILSKFRIAMNQTKEDILIYNLDNETTVKYINKINIQSTLAPITMQQEIPQGAYILHDKMTVKWQNEDMEMNVNDFKLKGKHNQYNGMAASLSATTVNIRKDKIREALQTFESLEHRTETVLNIKGVQYINDSKATNVNSVWFALEDIKKPTILIMGGIDKGNDYEILRELAQEKVKAIICLGENNKTIIEFFTGIVPNIVDTNSMVDAVKAAYSLATKGDVVLLSPACASFDLFNNYEDRGNQFKAAVKEL